MTKERLFISHAIEDEATANRIVAYLEAKGVACWVGARDIPAGSIYAEEITKGMKASSACAVIVSAAANASKGVKRELELASHSDKAFIPIRIDNVEPGDGLDYYLRSAQWIDYRRDGEGGLDRIIQPKEQGQPEPEIDGDEERRERPSERSASNPLTGLPTRAFGMLFSPTAEWRRVAAETTGTGAILFGYLLPLSALQGLATATGTTLFGVYGVFPDNPVLYDAFIVVLTIAVMLGQTLVISAVANAASRILGARSSFDRTLRLIAYSTTPTMVAGLLAAFPPLRVLSYVGLAHAFVLVYLGIHALLAPTNRFGLLAVIAVTWIVMMFVGAFLAGAVMITLLRPPVL